MKKWFLLLVSAIGAVALFLVLRPDCPACGLENEVVATTAIPSVQVVSEPIDDSNCIGCHTDQESLFALAEEPEENTLNEGEG